MKAIWKFGVVALLVATGALLWLKWRHDEPRRDCVRTLQAFCQSLGSSDSAHLLGSVILPKAIANRTSAEQAQFLREALRDEISPAGVDALAKGGVFGSLKEIFPTEADRWCAQAGVRPGDCVAFRMQHHGIRAEVVLAHEGEAYRVVRCNNVKQMAIGG